VSFVFHSFSSSFSIETGGSTIERAAAISSSTIAMQFQSIQTSPQEVSAVEGLTGDGALGDLGAHGRASDLGSHLGGQSGGEDTSGGHCI
jgi:hypothetical protein